MQLFIALTVVTLSPIPKVGGVSLANACFLRLQFGERPAWSGTRKKRACLEWNFVAYRDIRLSPIGFWGAVHAWKGL
jgi:hypothetical protein